MSDHILKIIKTLENEFERDTLNLTRPDQDAICIKIEDLKKFIRDIYEQHKRI